MKREEFKKIIKESVKEAIKEELMVTLVEVLSKSPSPSLNENYISEPKSSFNSRRNMIPDIRSSYPKPDFNGKEISFTSRDVPTPQPNYNPGGGGNTAGEGSSLPPGEVSLDQISSIMNR